MEATPAAYVAALVAVFREVHRVLRDDGTLWLNLGDSYAGGAGGRGDSGNSIGRADGTMGAASMKHDGQRIRRESPGLKPKDLMMIPARVAIALQDDGWYLRSDIIWSKRAPMPESVTDRPTSAHEHIFLLSKQPRYFYDADAVRETANTSGTRAGYAGYDKRAMAMGRAASGNEKAGTVIINGEHRNLRNVWELSPEPCSMAHFATFPSEIPRRCIKAGSRPGDIVLEPFAGSGTTGMVAIEQGRRAILVELNEAYLPIISKRLKAEQPVMFAPEPVAATPIQATMELIA